MARIFPADCEGRRAELFPVMKLGLARDEARAPGRGWPNYCARGSQQVGQKNEIGIKFQRYDLIEKVSHFTHIQYIILDGTPLHRFSD